jgi:hypothetical protein
MYMVVAREGHPLRVAKSFYGDNPKVEVFGSG